MNKVAIRVSGAPSFFDEIKAEAARLDRSPSWLLGFCLGTTLPKLGSVARIVVPSPSDERAAADGHRRDHRVATFVTGAR